MNRVEFVGDQVVMAGGTELTLNGVAQGYITDRIAELLARRGYRNVLVDLGEVRALGSRDDGSAFEIDWRELGGSPSGTRRWRCPRATPGLSADGGVLYLRSRTGPARATGSAAVRHPPRRSRMRLTALTRLTGSCAPHRIACS
jgi:hypothetical protein